jgi:transposase
VFPPYNRVVGYPEGGGLSAKARAKGPAAHGWDEDQQWTLARVAQVIRELFGQEYTLRGVSYLLHRIGWSPQVPVHRAAERDEEACAVPKLVRGS